MLEHRERIHSKYGYEYGLPRQEQGQVWRERAKRVV